MKTQTKFWDWVGEGISSLGAVLLPMLILITGGMFLSHTYFKQTLPGTMAFWEAFLSAWLIAIAWELTVLVTTVNQQHVNKWIPRIMAICSGIVFLFYIGAFDDELTTFARVQKGFVGALVSLVSYIYVELFNAKWNERIAGKTMPGQINELQSKLVETQRELNEAQLDLNELYPKLNELQSRVDKAEGFKGRIERELRCPHCNQQFTAFGTLHAHKGHCEHNPNRKIKINGHPKRFTDEN